MNAAGRSVAATRREGAQAGQRPQPGAPAPSAGPATSAVCGELTNTAGVALRWPDGETTEAVAGGVTGLGAALPTLEEMQR